MIETTMNFIFTSIYLSYKLKYDNFYRAHVSWNLHSTQILDYFYLHHKMAISFQELIDNNMIDAFDYMENITDFIDKKYNTSYNDCDMNDDIEQLSDKIKNSQDFDTVEQIYKLACEKYPLVKENKLLNPKFRLINSWYVFNKPFDELLDYLDHNYEDEKFDEKYNEVRQTLIRLFPKCEKTILLQTSLGDDLPDSDDEVWLIPRNEIESEEYKNLYSYVQTFRP